jgi:signal transduction histidine kinase
MGKRKMAVPLKTGLILCLSAAVFFSISITAFYIRGALSIRAAAGASQSRMASLMSSDIASLLDKEADVLESLAAGEDAVKKIITETDALYKPAKPDEMSLSLPRIQLLQKTALKNYPEITQICAINRFGIPVASSGETKASYYGNQEWWKSSFGAGETNVLIGEPETDASTGAWHLPFIVPLTDSKTGGDFIGAMRYLVNMNSFFGIFKGFKIGRTGEALVVDDRGYLVFNAQAKPFSNKFCGYDELQRILEDENTWFLIDSAYMHRGRVVASYSKIELPAKVKSDIKWRVFVIQDEKEISALLNSQILQMIWSAAILTLLLLIVGLVIGRRLTAPIRALQDGMARVGAGEIDYRVKKIPADEIGQLTGSFNDMLDSLKTTSTSVSKMNSELERRDEEIRKLTEIWSGLISAVTRLKDSVSQTMKIVGSVLAGPPHGEAAGKSSQLDPANRSALENAIKSMEKLSQHIDNLFDIGRIEGGEMSLKIAPVDIRGIMHDIIFFFEPKIREKGLDFRLDIPKARLEVPADAERIRQVLYSLIDNARKFTEKGYVAVSIKDLKNEVECSVTDTGSGISKEDINNIFDQSQRPGLSLFIAKSIIGLHNGRIWVESELKKGAKFIFRLPKK